MARESLQDVYVEQLKDLYNAEQQILRALPKMAKSAVHPELQKAFTDHEQLTRVHVERLEKIFQELGKAPGGHKCKGMEGLLAEGAELIEEHAESDALDAAMIAAALVDKAMDAERTLNPASGIGYFDWKNVNDKPDSTMKRAYDIAVAKGFPAVLNDHPQRYFRPALVRSR